MSNFARTILRAKVYPYRVGEQWKLATGRTPILYRGAGVDFWFSFWESSSQLLNVSNVSDVALLVKEKNDTTWYVLGSTTDIDPSLTESDWDAGSKAHAVLTILGADLTLAAGTYDATIRAHTTDDPVDVDVFGISTIEIRDVGVTSTPASPPPGETAATLEDLQAMMSGYLKTPLKPGQTIAYVSPDGQWRRIVGIDDNGQPIDYIESVS